MSDGAILITGSEGLIGRHLSDRIEFDGGLVRRFDVRRTAREDVADKNAVCAALSGVQGVVHLAAVSRVVWAQDRPEKCWAVNVDALRQLLDLCLGCSPRPWFVFASSREVYGNPSQLPVSETADLSPINIYGRSKREGERLVAEAAEAGLCTNILRLSNVYGCRYDHQDRVVMAFSKAAANGGTIKVEGASNTFDFTAITDVADGCWRAARATMDGESLPPVHLVSGHGTSLRELAETAVKFARMPVKVEEAPARTYDVERFIGDSSRALELLGWTATTPITEGMSALIDQLAQPQGAGA